LPLKRTWGEEGGSFMLLNRIKFYVLLLVSLCVPLSICPATSDGASQSSDNLRPFLLKQHIYIIGASTVRYDNNLPGDINSNTGYAQYPTRMGWGAALSVYAQFPQNVFNLARRGATSASYRDKPPSPGDPAYKGPCWWGSTKVLIASMGKRKGGYLFIQFGGNDRFANISEQEFKENLRFYRQQAIALGLTPVFISPVESRSTGPTGTRGNYPQWMADVAQENNNSIFLDLHQKSLEFYLQYTLNNLGYMFGNVPYIWLSDGNVDGVAHEAGDFRRMDTTHFEERGALRVAAWIKELACDLSDKSLCYFFQDRNFSNPPTIYFTGEYVDDPNDPEINGWYIADPNGQILIADMANPDIIQKVFDNSKNSMVLAFNTYFNNENRYLEHGFHNSNDARSWANKDQYIIAWDSRFTSSDFRIYVEVATQDGIRHFTFKPVDEDQGPGETMPQYIRIGLGTNAVDGMWHSYRRDLSAELHQYEPDNEIVQINGVRIKGTGNIDNLRLF